MLSPSPPSRETSTLFALPDKFFYMNHMARQWNTGAHHHQGLELAMIVHGSATHCTTDGETSCHLGHILVIPPGIWHAYTNCHQLELFNCLFSPELLDGALAWTAQDPAISPILQPSPLRPSSHVLTLEMNDTAVRKLRKLILDLQRIYKNSGATRPVKLVAALMVLLDYIAHNAKPLTPCLSAPVHSAVRRAAELLCLDLAHPWTLPELAARLCINPSYLVRLFRAHTGSTPMKFLARERANKAAQLLMITKLNINEIGAAVGWPEPKQFARSFRGHFAETATAFRNRLKTGDLFQE